eukprot:m.55349 g.55349  ORF g.55349 m.55349 type:complete len:622 (-) comp13306_c0_seq1:1-1866(-)
MYKRNDVGNQIHRSSELGLDEIADANLALLVDEVLALREAGALVLRALHRLAGGHQHLVVLQCEVLVALRVRLGPALGDDAVVAGRGAGEGVVVVGDVVLCAEGDLVEEHDADVVCGGADVAGRLAVLAGQVDALADAAARVRHDAQAGLEDGGDDSDVGAVPEQLAVGNGLVLGKALALGVAVDGKDVDDLAAAARVLRVLLDDLVLLGGGRQRRDVGRQRLVGDINRVGLLAALGRRLLGLGLVGGGGELDVTEDVEHVELGLDGGRGVEDGRDGAAEAVRDLRVEAAGQLLHLGAVALGHGVLELLQRLVALEDLRRGQLAERHLLRVDLHALHLLAEHVVAEDQAEQVLRLLGQRRLAHRLAAAATSRGGGALLAGLGLVVLVVVAANGHVDERVLAGLGAEAAALGPGVAGLVLELLLEELDGLGNVAAAGLQVVLARLADAAPVRPHRVAAALLVDLHHIELVVVGPDVGLVERGLVVLVDRCTGVWAGRVDLAHSALGRLGLGLDLLGERSLGRGSRIVVLLLLVGRALGACRLLALGSSSRSLGLGRRCRLLALSAAALAAAGRGVVGLEQGNQRSLAAGGGKRPLLAERLQLRNLQAGVRHGADRENFTRRV